MRLLVAVSNKGSEYSAPFCHLETSCGFLFAIFRAGIHGYYRYVSILLHSEVCYAAGENMNVTP